MSEATTCWPCILNIDPDGRNTIAIGAGAGAPFGPPGIAIGVGIGIIAGAIIVAPTIYDYIVESRAHGKGERGKTGPGDRNANPDKHKKFNKKTGKWEKRDPHSGKWKPTTPPAGAEGGSSTGGGGSCN
ncbi:MAG: hypothetical protein AAF449_08660, partial [Myxococcota bacterium]